MTFLAPLAGGALIGAASSLLLAFHGRVAGITGIFEGALLRSDDDREAPFRLPFLAGLAIVGLVVSFLVPASLGAPVRGAIPIAVAGLLVGFGTRLSNGCTSGHGVSGLARLSLRSLVATLTFIGTGVLTTFVLGAGR